MLNKDVCKICVKCMEGKLAKNCHRWSKYWLSWDSTDEDNWEDGIVECRNNDMHGWRFTINEIPKHCIYSTEHAVSKPC
jgi:hypothetical protein